MLRNERFFGKFERQVALPFQVDATRVTASYTDGVLTVTLPKAEEAKPRQIEIHVSVTLQPATVNQSTTDYEQSD